MIGSAGRVRGSLKARVLISCVAAITLVFAIVGVAQYTMQRGKLEAALAASIEGAANRLETGLVAPLWNLSPKDGVDLLRGEMLVGDISGIR